MKREKICGIYKITNPIGESYIGSSRNIRNRFLNHKNYSNNVLLKNSIIKYGVELHTFEVIKECADFELSFEEKKYINHFKCLGVLFNSKPTGRKKLSEAKKKQVVFIHIKGEVLETLGRSIIQETAEKSVNKEYLKAKKQTTLAE
jgi:group I intron endonuclease